MGEGASSIYHTSESEGRMLHGQIGIGCEEVSETMWPPRAFTKRTKSRTKSWPGSERGLGEQEGHFSVRGSTDDRVIQTSLLKLHGVEPCNMLNEVLIRRTLNQTLRRVSSSESVGRRTLRTIGTNPPFHVRALTKEVNVMRAEEEKKRQRTGSSSVASEERIFQLKEQLENKKRRDGSKMTRFPSFKNSNQYRSLFRSDNESEDEEDFKENGKEKREPNHCNSKYPEEKTDLSRENKQGIDDDETRFFSNGIDRLFISKCEGKCCCEFEGDDEKDDDTEWDSICRLSDSKIRPNPDSEDLATGEQKKRTNSLPAYKPREVLERPEDRKKDDRYMSNDSPKNKSDELLDFLSDIPLQGGTNTKRIVRSGAYSSKREGKEISCQILDTSSAKDAWCEENEDVNERDIPPKRKYKSALIKRATSLWQRLKIYLRARDKRSMVEDSITKAVTQRGCF